MAVSPVEALAQILPCAGDDHAPWYIKAEEGADGIGIYGFVRTTSWHRDGGGGRTDLHDTLSALWAMCFRACGLASSRLISGNFLGISPEISSRFIIFEQPLGSIFTASQAPSIMKRLKSHAALFHHEIMDIIRFTSEREPTWQEEVAPRWVAPVRDLLKIKSAEIWIARSNPDWNYYTANGNEVSITELPPDAGMRLRSLFFYYDPVTSQRGSHHVLRALNLYNVVSDSVLKRGVRILRCIEGNDAPPWRGLGAKASEHAIFAVPLESHCVLLGRRTLVVLRSRCGYDEYVAQRQLWHDQTRREADIFNFSAQCVWTDKVDPSRFEELACALLQDEPGFEWVRQAGPTRDRDQGRDLIATWLTTPAPDEKLGDVETPFLRRMVVVQVKTRSRTIGKADVRDVRDTLDRHQAHGYFLVGFPNISNDLVNYLGTLRSQGYWVDWWTRQQLDDRIRRRPHIAALFPDLVRLQTDK